MATRVEARISNSERENTNLRAEIDTQTMTAEQLRVQTAVNYQLQAQVARLTAEISRVKNESIFSQDAYRGIQSQYDELVERHANTINEDNGLRDQFSQSQACFVQAEKRSKVLEKEVEGLKQRMRKAGEALDVAAF